MGKKYGMYPEVAGVHALVIDYSASNVEVHSALLAAEGVRVSSFARPERAEAALPDLPPVDVVFCDLEMPSLTGYQLLPRIRRQLGLDVPVIAYSVHTSEMDRARRAGFDGFLGKPIDGDVFAALLGRILRGEPVWTAC